MQFKWNSTTLSNRSPVFAKEMVVTSQPLAAQVGLKILQQGGNAVDAAIATAITLTVVEPTNTGIGGDALAMVYINGELHAINGSGPSPKLWTSAQFDGPKMPVYGWNSVTVPGAVSVWGELSARFGSLDFKSLFTLATTYARDGFFVSPQVAKTWRYAEEAYQHHKEFKRVYLSTGCAPQPGDHFCNPDQANTLEHIGNQGYRSFYEGDIAEKIAKAASLDQALLSKENLTAYHPSWVEPLRLQFLEYSILELPPQCGGITVLIALAILARWNISAYPLDSLESVHLQIEATKLAMQEAQSDIADPRFMKKTAAELLSEKHITLLANRINLQQTLDIKNHSSSKQDTVYVAVGDKQGNLVSFIQSNYYGFGSGIVVPDTGIALHNRGYGFTTQAGHPNQVDGGKYPYHTIMPAMVLDKTGLPIICFGVVGGPMQPQAQVQLLVRMLCHQQSPQLAIDAPRWCIDENGMLQVEKQFNKQIVGELEKKNHKIKINLATDLFGGAQILCKNQQGGYVAASDGRKDGQAVGW